MAPGALLEDVEGKPSARGNNGATAPTTNIAKQGLRDAILHRNARSTPLTLESAHGSRYKVSDGTKEWDVFDASGGASVACIGHNDSRPLQAVLDHFASTGITYAPSGSFRTKISETFAKLLIRTTDCQMAKAVFYSSGSEANEAIKKAAIQYHTREKPNPDPGRNLFIARERSYHGATMGALGLSGHKSRREIFEPSLPQDTAFISPCYEYRDMEQGMSNKDYVNKLAQELENKILEFGPKKVAGFFAEPVVGAALGCVPAVEGYLKAMKKVCVKYGVLFILDEVMCGMGRTGYTHAWQEENVVPDIQAVGKGLAGGYAPISAVLFGHDIVKAFQNGPGNGAFAHGHTFQNFPEACAAALAVQKIIEDDGLLANVREKGELLRWKLEEGLKGHRYVGDIRGKGLFLGIEFVSDKDTKEPFDPSHNIAQSLHESGLTEDYGIYIYPGTGTVDGFKGDHVIVSPAFTITHADVDTIVERMVKLVEGFFDELDESCK